MTAISQNLMALQIAVKRSLAFRLRPLRHRSVRAMLLHTAPTAYRT